MPIKLRVDGIPVAASRPRFSIVRGRGHAYTDAKYRAYQALLHQEYRHQYQGKPLEGPVYVKLDVFRKIQKSISKQERVKRLSHVHRPLVKPDVDNYFKSVTDACTGLIWHDDAQVVSETTNKYYSENPRIEIEVGRIDELKQPEA